MQTSISHFNTNSFVPPSHVCWKKQILGYKLASSTPTGSCGFYKQPPMHITVRRRRSQGFLACDIIAQDVYRLDSSEALKLAVLVSGSGRSVENLCESIEDGRLTRCKIALVIASKGRAGAIERVKRYGIHAHVIRPIDYGRDINRFSDAISNMLDDFSIDLVVMAGWMHFYLIPDRYFGKVLNIHPSLIPSFCGQGFYGSQVHEAVVRLICDLIQCTIFLKHIIS